ncbi:hypothetical protein [Deinococcus ruber]|nr:hypothetical protein [Deinococcus ruber]
MGYDEAETTRELLKDVGSLAFQLMHYDAIRDICLQAERYVAAVQREAPDELAAVQGALSAWKRALEQQLQSGSGDVHPMG